MTDDATSLPVRGSPGAEPRARPPRVPRRVGAVVLAAGAARRFGGAKLLAPLRGRPLLQYAIDAAADTSLEPVVVVLGAGAADVEPRIAWRGAHRVINPTPEAGLSSSLRLGIDGLRALDAGLEAILVLLGDQPLVREIVLQRLREEPLDPDRPILAPRYANGDGPNPARLEPAAWGLVEELRGDRGFGPIIAARPDIVRWLPFAGDNPDVDTPDDLAGLAVRGGPVAGQRSA